MFLFVQRASQQIFQKECAQGLDWFRRERSQKARERRTSGELLTPEERHEGICPGSKPFVEGFQGAFSTDRISQRHSYKVEDFIVTETPPSKAYLFSNG